MARVGYLFFLVIEETIAIATKIPREGTRWHKHLFIPQSSYIFARKPYFQHVAGSKGFHREWVKSEYLNPLTIIIRLITYEGKFTVFKIFHLRLLAHFVNQQFLNFLFYFHEILEKMLIQVRKKTVNPMGILYHHSLIKILIVHQLKERNQTWDNFVFKVLNPHLNVQECPRHIKDPNPSQTPPKERKSPKIVHIDEDIPEVSSPIHSPTPVNLESVEFIPVP